MPKIITTEDVINISKIRHGDKYDYSLVDYINAKTKIKIICPKHGVFEQIPYDHMYENGCRKCGRDKCSEERRYNNSIFIEKAKSIHGNKYDYSLVDYKKSNTKVKIICHTHGVFEQTPNTHLSGSGCNKCAHISKGLKSRIKKEDFIKKCKIIHKNKYEYSLVIYINSDANIDIICPYHGVFSQRAIKHKKGQGCPKCGKEKVGKHNSQFGSGWTVSSWDKAAERSKNFDSFKVYIIKCWNDNEEFYKIGRTFTTTKHRFRRNRLMPYNYEIIKELIFDNAKDAFYKEMELKNKNKKFKYIPNIKFEGMYECFYKIILKNELV